MSVIGYTNETVREGATLSSVPKVGDFTLQEINDLFAEIATIVNNKIDKDGEVGLTTTNILMGLNQIINLPDAVAPTDAVPLHQLEGMV